MASSTEREEAVILVTAWWRAFTEFRARAVLVAVIAPASGFVIVYALAVLTWPGQWLDDWFFGLAQRQLPSPAEWLLPFLARRLMLVALAVIALVLGGSALRRHAWRELGAAALTTGLSVGAARVLRAEVLSRPDLGNFAYPQNTLPSTHVAAAAALTAAVLLLWPRRRPWWLSDAATVVVIVACAGNLIGHAHRPSDALASLLLVASVTAFSCAVFRPATLSGGPTPIRQRVPPRSDPR